jgi:hypothetical protein
MGIASPQRRRGRKDNTEKYPSSISLRLLCALCVSAVSLVCTLGWAEIIDRVALTVDNQVITESRVLEEVRLAAFLNGEKPDLSGSSKRRAAARLVRQSLIRREMELTQYPLPPASEADRMVEQLVQGRFPDAAGYRSELASCGISEETFKQYLLRQAAVLRFIDVRFKPEIQVTDLEIRDCYENRVLPEYRRRGGRGEPSFDDARAQCEEMLASERVDKLVERWLKDTLEHTRVVYKEEAFR